MKRKNGFTLIELLAVIVILAVIALIAVPQVIKILNKARLSAAEDTTYGITKAAESYIADFMLKNNGDIPSETLEFSCNNEGCTLTTTLTGYDLTNLDKIEFKGTKPDSGTVTISDSGKTIIATNLKINGFACNYNNEVAKCEATESNNETTTTSTTVSVVQNGYTIEEATEDETYKAVVYLDPTNLETECNASNSVVGATGTNSGCMKWYAYAETDTTYDLILDHNTTAIVNGFEAAQTQVVTDTANWDSSLNARNIKADEIATITGHPTFNYSTAKFLDWFYLYSNNQTQTATTQGASKYSWLYDYTYKCTNYGCNIADSLTSGYWTQDLFLNNTINAWRMRNNGCLDAYSITDSVSGVRPVITIKK